MAYAGGGNVHKYAEGGEPWETYISGRSAGRERNINIWQEAGRRLDAPGSRRGDMASNREVSVKLIAQVDDFVAAMDRATEAAERFTRAAREAKELRDEEGPE